VIVAVMTATVVVAGVSVAAAATDQDDDDDEPQAGTVVAIVEIHDCHLASRHSMRRKPKGGLAAKK
jgi:hypothetical protein